MRQFKSTTKGTNYTKINGGQNFRVIRAFRGSLYFWVTGM